MIIAEHWINEDGFVSTLIPKGEPRPDDPELTILCCEIIGKDWEECMKQYDKHMGF